MKLLFISDVSMENPASGSEQVLFHQCMQLSKAGADVCAVTRRNGTGHIVYRQIGGVREGSYAISSEHRIYALPSVFGLPSRIMKQFSQSGPFAAAVGHQPISCFSLLAGGRLRRLPLLYVFHSPSHEEHQLLHATKGRLRTFPGILVRRVMEYTCLGRSTRIMTLSRFMAEKIQSVHGIDGNRIVVNPGGVDTQRFRPPGDRCRLKEKLGFPAGRVHLLTVRNLEPRMGLDNLLRSMAMLRENIPRLHLLLVGDGPEKATLRNLIRTLSLVGEVTLTGFADPEFLPEYYGAADFFILPTRQLEGFGLVTVESLACGTPVCGTPVGATVEILKNFDPAFLFSDPSPEAMAAGIRATVRRYQGEDASYGALRDRCRVYAEQNYTWERHGRQLKGILDDLPGRKNSGSSGRLPTDRSARG